MDTILDFVENIYGYTNILRHPEANKQCVRESLFEQTVEEKKASSF